ncbi:Splicing factor U2AF 65 kDa subunit [Linum perenne]
MSGIGRGRHKDGRSSGSSQGNVVEETCARTRPFSFDEIINRRKMKKLADIDKADALGVDVPEDKSEKVDGHDKARSSSVLESSLPKQVRSSSMPYAENSVVKDEHQVGGKGREIQPMARKLKSQINRDLVMTETKRQDDRKVHGREKFDDQLLRDSVKDRYADGRRGQYRRADDPDRRKSQKRSFGGSGKETAKKHSRELVEINRRVEGSRGRFEKDLEKTHRSRENCPRSENVTENEVPKNLSRDYMQKDRHVDRTRRKIENRSKPRDEVQDLGKKQDAAKVLSLDTSHRVDRKELSKSHYRESGLKRRRSRSREHRAINQSSASMSLRTQKHESSVGRGHESLSSHSKGRSERRNIDEKKRKIVNGSSTQFVTHSPASGLGGYSPRKRKSEAAVKTPSPAKRSPEKKSAKWDLAPKGNKESMSAVILANDLLSNQQLSSILREVVNTVPISSDPGTSVSGVSASSLLTTKNTSIDSVQLTQSTRPIRRLYVENVPASASEKAVIDFLNNSLVSYGVNHVSGTQPCISCIINKEKGQALVEFLTPEDASAALSFDGWSFSGCTIKIRRPKDYVEMATSEAKKPVAVVQAISHIVVDSPHKIFIGGISKVLSSKMLMEIAGAFGPLKGYQFLNNAECDGPRAFLEYADQNVTLKACAGLNGMKIGGQVLTAVQAVPDASIGIPEHAKPLLENPTEVLKLMNVLKAEALPSMSDAEIEEVLEDVRVECARFGAVKSINVIRHTAIHNTTTRTCSGYDSMVSSRGQEDLKFETNSITEADKENCALEHKIIEDSITNGERPQDNLTVAEGVQHLDDSSMAAEDPESNKTETDFTSSEQTGEIHMLEMTMNDKPKAEGQANVGESREVIAETTVETNTEMASASCNDTNPTSSDAQKGENTNTAEQDLETGRSFEIGSVLVEFRRTEASCKAAHCLHGRSFDDRTVIAEYVPLELYKAKFQKQ